jgi:hypothetical protein
MQEFSSPRVLVRDVLDKSLSPTMNNQREEHDRAHRPYEDQHSRNRCNGCVLLVATEAPDGGFWAKEVMALSAAPLDWVAVPGAENASTGARGQHEDEK